MTSASLKIKAVCLILLLAGQEAYRIQSDARLTLSMQKALTPAEDRWSEASKQCNWKIQKIFKGGCSGEGCSFRPLPLDRSLSESCRLSDTYMLSNASSRGEFVDLAAQLLEAKSVKFKDGCAGAKLWEVSKQFHCHRRAGHMLRSAALLSKAAKVDKSLAHEKQYIERALNNIASAFGTDGAHLLEFKDKLKGDISSFAKDPTGTFKHMISTVSKLLGGSENDKDEARETIRNMPSKNSSQNSRRTKKELGAAAKIIVREYNLDKPDEVNEAWSNLDRVASNQEADEAGSALLQTDGQASGQNFSIAMWLLVNIVLNVIIWIICLVFGIDFFWVFVVFLIIIVFSMLMGGIKSLFKSSDSRRRHSRRGGNGHGHRTGKRH